MHDPKTELVPRDSFGNGFYLKALVNPKDKDGIGIPAGYSTLVDCGIEVTTTENMAALVVPAEFVVAGGGICQPLIFTGTRQIMLRIYATIKPIVITNGMIIGELHLFKIDRDKKVDIKHKPVEVVNENKVK